MTLAGSVFVLKAEWNVNWTVFLAATFAGRHLLRVINGTVLLEADGHISCSSFLRIYCCCACLEQKDETAKNWRCGVVGLPGILYTSVFFVRRLVHGLLSYLVDNKINHQQGYTFLPRRLCWYTECSHFNRFMVRRQNRCVSMLDIMK